MDVLLIAATLTKARWVAWNHARTWLCTASLGSYCWALLQA
jgi:hypothetical protein